MTTEKEGKYGFTDDVLANGGKYDSGALRSVYADRIKGTVFADQSGKLRIFQGMEESETDDIVTDIAVSASSLAGDGVGFTVDSVGIWCRIEFENDSGSAQTVFRLGWKLTPQNK